MIDTFLLYALGLVATYLIVRTPDERVAYDDQDWSDMVLAAFISIFWFISLTLWVSELIARYLAGDSRTSLPAQFVNEGAKRAVQERADNHAGQPTAAATESVEPGVAFDPTKHSGAVFDADNAGLGDATRARGEDILHGARRGDEPNN